MVAAGNCTSLMSLDLDDGDAGMNLVLGVFFTMVSSVVDTGAMMLMKLEQLKNKERRAAGTKADTEWNGIVLNKRWLFGLFLMIFVAAPSQGAAVTLASQSVVMPFAGLNIALSMVIGPRMLGERVSRADLTAVAVIILGTVLSTVAGPQTGVHYDAAYVMARWQAPEVLALLAVEAAAAVAAVAALRGGWVGSKWWAEVTLWGFLLGLYGGMMNTVFKGMGEIAESGGSAAHGLALGGFDGRALAAYCVLVAVMAAVLMVILNMGLSRFDGTLVYPLYLGFLIVFGVVNGAVYWEEAACFGALQWCLFPVGVLVTIGGMLALSVARQGARSEGAAAGAEAGGKPTAARTSGAKVMPARAAAAGVAAATPGALPPLALVDEAGSRER